MFIPADSHFTDHLAGRVDLFEPWPEIDAWITSFCPCSLELSCACSVKQRSRAKRSRSRSCRRAERGRSADPATAQARIEKITISRVHGERHQAFSNRPRTFEAFGSRHRSRKCRLANRDRRKAQAVQGAARAYHRDEIDSIAQQIAADREVYDDG